MAANKPHRNYYRVAEAKQQMKDKIGTDQVEIELSDGSVVSFPHPMFYPKDLKAELKELSDDDSEGIALALLGEDQLDRFVKDGNDVDDLQFIVMQVQADAQAALAGRKRPTRS